MKRIFCCLRYNEDFTKKEKVFLSQTMRQSNHRANTCSARKKHLSQLPFCGYTTRIITTRVFPTNRDYRLSIILFFLKKYSGVHPRVSTLIQPSFQKTKKRDFLFWRESGEKMPTFAPKKNGVYASPAGFVSLFFFFFFFFFFLFYDVFLTVPTDITDGRNYGRTQNPAIISTAVISTSRNINPP